VAAAPSKPAGPFGPTAAQRAYAYVKERLLDGRFTGGTLLSENALALQLGLSRTPIRQALVQLESEGLVDLYPKRGALVVPISASEADDVHEARLLVEEHSARRAAEVGPALAAELQAAIAGQQRALAGEMNAFARFDREFHRAIVAAAGNRLLTRAYDAFADRHQRISAATVASDPARMELFIAEHVEIAAALAGGEAGTAADLIATHLRGAHEMARRRP
jgi:DNA-binding GntR family transcriptional regulator